MLKVSRESSRKYLKNQDKPWKHKALAEEMKKINFENECNDTYGRKRMFQALTLRQPEGVHIPSELKIHFLKHVSTRLLSLKGVSLFYGSKEICSNISFEVKQGDRIALCGKNGCGKSTILKFINGNDKIKSTGNFEKVSNLKISYVSQDTSHLTGNLSDFAKLENIDESLFKTILRKLDFSRTQFEKDISDFSGGQKKKVLIAKSLCEQAHLYLWDELLNFIDILSRIQIEDLILKFQPTILFVEHDKIFSEKIATKILKI